MIDIFDPAVKINVQPRSFCHVDEVSKIAWSVTAVIGIIAEIDQNGIESGMGDPFQIVFCEDVHSISGVDHARCKQRFFQ